MSYEAEQYTFELEETVGEVYREAMRGILLHGPYSSLHEGLAVAWEEFEELKLEVFKGGGEPRDLGALRTEAIQVAACALKIAVHATLEEESA